MKSFKNYLKEASGYADKTSLGGSLEVNPSDLGNPDVLRRLNAIVGQVAN